MSADPKIIEPVKATVVQTFHVQHEAEPDEWHGWGSFESPESAIYARDRYRKDYPDRKFRATTTITSILVLEI